MLDFMERLLYYLAMGKTKEDNMDGIDSYFEQQFKEMR